MLNKNSVQRLIRAAQVLTKKWYSIAPKWYAALMPGQVINSIQFYLIMEIATFFKVHLAFRVKIYCFVFDTLEKCLLLLVVLFESIKIESDKSTWIKHKSDLLGLNWKGTNSLSLLLWIMKIDVHFIKSTSASEFHSLDCCARKCHKSVCHFV